MAELMEMGAGIGGRDQGREARARVRLDSLTKPLGSLGRMEDVAALVVGVLGEVAAPLRKGVWVFAADHGVTAEGVSAYPAEVTRQMVENFVGGGAAVSVLARVGGVRMEVVDVGVDGEEFDERLETEGLVQARVRRGSRNLAREAAMTEAEMLAAIGVGMEAAERARAAGLQVVAVGEMGIGNTTAASAMTAALTEHAASEVTGRGTGVTEAGFKQKCEVVAAAVGLHFGDVGRRSDVAAVEVLRCVGGLEIAAMVGMYLGLARAGMVAVCDGFISTAAAAVAVGIAPRVAEFLVAGHRSEERGHGVLLERMKLAPMLDLRMRLGEGTGAVLAMGLMDAAMSLYGEMATFAGAGVSEAEA